MLKDIDHHLYQHIRVMCKSCGTCFATRETMCRWLGKSGKSVGVITTSIKTLTHYGLIVVVYEDNPDILRAKIWHISLADNSERNYEKYIASVQYEVNIRD